ncbi:hypothetical protein HN51_011759 [Arachis hypogaea]|nr:putative oxidoreductase [Arachis hypogaea]
MQLSTQNYFMASSRATRVLSLTRRPFSSSSSLKFDAGVSMVQGASRGIGLEFVKQLLEKNDKGHVVATCRNPDASTGLAQLKDKFAESLKLLPLDLTVETSIQASASSVRETYGHLNLLINASGILSIPQVLQPETSLNKLEKSALMLTYEINAVGPILVIKVKKKHCSGGQFECKGWIYWGQSSRWLALVWIFKDCTQSIVKDGCG